MLLAATPAAIFSQPVDYRAVFGDDWKKAEDFIAQNESWIRPELKKYDIGFYEAMAIIFPELVRYSAIRDKMETTLLKALYINLGKEYADFSIGHFQMKPAFAEMVGMTASRTLSHRYCSLVKDSSDFQDIREYRSAVVKDLEGNASQLNYLVVFCKICYNRFNIRKMGTEERIRFLATAYNYGFLKNADEIRSMEDRKFFSTELLSRNTYSYCDISLFWYKDQMDSK
jgi:hypothetical protein